MVSRVIKAKYTEGAFTPLEPVGHREDEVVEIIVPELKEDEEVFLSSAGGWRDLIPEEFIKEVYERRLPEYRPPVEL